MIGNDIVDFSIDEKKYTNQRYVARCLSELEARYLDQSDHKNKLFWCLWAVKEAAYKAIQRGDISCIFSPPSFALTKQVLEQLLKHDFKKMFIGTLNYKSTIIHFELKHIETNVVHCVASSDESALINCQVAIECHSQASDYSAQSSLVRELADKLLRHNKIQAHISRPEIDLIKYSKKGPPVLIDNKTEKHRSDIISLSHDKNWLAVVFLLK